MTCDACRDVCENPLSDPPGLAQGKLGTLGEIQERAASCRTCRQLLELLQSDVGSAQQTGPLTITLTQDMHTTKVSCTARLRMDLQNSTGSGGMILTFNRAFPLVRSMNKST